MVNFTVADLYERKYTGKISRFEAKKKNTSKFTLALKALFSFK